MLIKAVFFATTPQKDWKNKQTFELSLPTAQPYCFAD